jgi:hypothetical protein
MDINKPDFGQMSEREILIVVATEQNTIQQRLNDHGKRLRVLEGLAKTATGLGIAAGVVVGWIKLKVVSQ